MAAPAPWQVAGGPLSEGLIIPATVNYVGKGADLYRLGVKPSGANLVQDQTGAHYLVDWESARVAPPERDLVDLGSSDRALDHYWQLAESPPARADLLRLYRLWYALAETSVYLLQFRASHTADDNMLESWKNFLTFLPGRQGSVF